MSKSLEDIYRHIQEQQAIRDQQKLFEQQQAFERIARDAEYRRMMLYKEATSYNPLLTTTTTTSSAGSGGGSGNNNVIDPEVYTSEASDCVIYVFFDSSDDYHKYLVHNYTTNVTSPVTSFGLDSSYYRNDSATVDDRGFLYIYSNDDIYRAFIIDTNGSLLYDESLESYDIGYHNKFLTISYYDDNDDKYYLVIYDGTLRILDFDTSINIISNYNSHFKHGTVVLDYNGNYYLIKNESIDKIFLRQDSEFIESTCFLYSYSNNIVFKVGEYDEFSNYSDRYIEVYDMNGSLILNYDTSSISSSLILDSYISQNRSDGFFMFGYDDDDGTKYILYYSGVSSSISYITVDSSYSFDYYHYNSHISSYNSYNSYYADSNVFIFYKDYVSNDYYLSYYESVYVLPVFKTDTSLRDTYDLNVEMGGVSQVGFSTDLVYNYEDNINLIVGGDDEYINIVSFKRSDLTISINTTSALSDNINNSDHLNTRGFIVLVNNDYSESNFISMTGSLLLTSATYSNNYDWILNRDTLYFLDYGNYKGYYTNSIVGNDLILTDFFESYDRPNEYRSVDNLSNGVILLINYEDTICRVLTDTTIGPTFSILLSENINSAKYNISIGSEFLSIHQFSDSGGGFSGMPYTHTKFGYNGPIASTSSFLMDGTVVNSDSIFGTGSSYFTNLYPGMFVLSAENISISDFYISGNLGADGSGVSDSYDYVVGSYSVYVKRVKDSGGYDPSVNHIIIINTDGTGVVHDVSYNTDNDYHRIYNIQLATEIHYLLIAKYNGSIMTNGEVSDVVNSYLNIIDGKDINDTLSDINSNYTDITDNVASIYYFSDHSSDDNHISDGGDDMYDGGNYINATIYDGPVEPSIISKIAYFTFNGDIIDSLDIESGTLNTNSINNTRAHGFYQDTFYIFDGTSINIINGSFTDIDYTNNNTSD